MPNTNTITRTVTSTDKVVYQVLINSDGSEETDLVLYDSSAVATALGKADPLRSTLLDVKVYAQKAANTATLTFEYDATTDIIALPLSLTAASSSLGQHHDFKEEGGIVNLANGTTGATGDITLTTTTLDNGDKILIVLTVKPY